MRSTFTFWSLLAILEILLYALITPKVGSNPGRARIMAAQGDISTGIKSAIDQFKMDNGYYPKSLQDLVQQPPGAKNWHGPYFNPPNLPIDPWGNNYIYECPGKHNTNSYDLMSVGPDGKIGTEDDIGNWTK